jgi:hypothetical protein
MKIQALTIEGLKPASAVYRMLLVIMAMVLVSSLSLNKPNSQVKLKLIISRLKPEAAKI